MKSWLVRQTFCGIATAAIFVAVSSPSFAGLFKVTITNNAPTGGAALAPVWVGFHDGTFDTYDGGSPASSSLESLAEDGNVSGISADFAAQQSNGVQGTLATLPPPPIQPGQSVTQSFLLSAGGNNSFFSYASMVLPSNDFFVANRNPQAHDISALFGTSGSITFDIGLPGTVNDAGTEVEDYNTSAANGLFGLPGGQGGPNIGANQSDVITNVIGPNPLGALNFPGNLDLSAFDFNNAALYPNGIATVTISAVPEPTSLGLFGFGLVSAGVYFRRRSQAS
ncbi:PEP-CTERM motif protein [Thalassoglobus neptunius]|uniref:PEP-CTERM motif protein n=1 Tax=Thalassoglobus neptunius TaxID=1938619 RepID=A0A5C5VBN5_9PLAN|nr:spondin domain-containing protein [Thalassoglobus neptunius]TWT35025.1 PEP-CTERM motif protein [Thalassoglobus neptunius]